MPRHYDPDTISYLQMPTSDPLRTYVLPSFVLSMKKAPKSLHWDAKSKIFLGRGHCPLPRPLPQWEDTPFTRPSTTALERGAYGAYGAFFIASILFSVILGPDCQFSLYFFLYIPDLGFRRSRETAYQLYTRGSVIDEAWFFSFKHLAQPSRNFYT